MEGKAQSQLPAPHAFGWQSSALQVGTRGTMSRMHGAANNSLPARCFLGRPTRRSGLCRNSTSTVTAERSCWQTACVRKDLTNSWGVADSWGKEPFKSRGKYFFQFRCGFDVSCAFFFSSLNEDGNFKWKNRF